MVPSFKVTIKTKEESSVVGSGRDTEEGDKKKLGGAKAKKKDEKKKKKKKPVSARERTGGGAFSGGRLPRERLREEVDEAFEGFEAEGGGEAEMKLGDEEFGRELEKMDWTDFREQSFTYFGEEKVIRRMS